MKALHKCTITADDPLARGSSVSLKIFGGKRGNGAGVTDSIQVEHLVINSFFSVSCLVQLAF